MDEHGTVPEDSSTGIALSKLLDQLSKRRTLVIVIEQVELADDTLLSTMEDVFSGSFMPPVLFVFTLNPRFIIDHSKVSAFLDLLQRSQHSKVIQLKPFTLEETILFIDEHTYTSPRYLAEYRHEETHGIPAYVRQLPKSLDAEVKHCRGYMRQLGSRSINSLPPQSRRFSRLLLLTRLCQCACSSMHAI